LRKERQIFFYRTKVDNVSRKCIPYIDYTLAKKWALVVVEKCGVYDLYGFDAFKVKFHKISFVIISS